MTPLEAMAKAYWENRGSLPWDGLTPALKKQELDDMRAALIALGETELPSIAFYKAGLALGELHKQNPGARGGDQLAAQWKAVCMALASGEDL